MAHPERTHKRREQIVEPRHPQQDKAPSSHAAQSLSAISDNSNSNNWCGARYTHPNGQFSYISADWNVAYVFTSFNVVNLSSVSMWAGLDNSPTDLFQAGTESQCINVQEATGNLPYQYENIQITNYYAWIETLPAPEWQIPNFWVNPADTVTLDIFLANQSGETIYKDGGDGGLTPQDNSVWFLLTNQNTRAQFLGYYPATTGFTGSTAEFILERSQYNGSYVPLATFDQTFMGSCYYGDALYGQYNSFVLGSNNGVKPPDGTLTYLNMVDTSYNHLLATPVVFPDPSNANDAWGILFVWQNNL